MLGIQKLTQTKNFIPISMGTVGFCIWYNCHPQTCISFIMGIFTTIAAEVLGISYFLSIQASQCENSKISVTMGKDLLDIIVYLLS